MEAQDTEELARFRQRWKEELKHTKEKHIETIKPSDVPKDQQSSSSAEVRDAVVQPVPVQRHTPLEQYTLAVQYEQQGLLDEALTLYRQSFRRDPNVDKAYHREEQKKAIAAHTFVQPKHPPAESSSSRPALIQTDAHILDLKHLTITDDTRRPLHAVLANFPHDLVFLPEDDNKYSPFRLLPEEIVIHILIELARINDTTTIERFASVSRKGRMLSLDGAIWRDLARRIYIPPQIPESLTVDDLVSAYKEDYRRIYIEQPRLRLDGVYIAVCHYVRNGLSENHWVSVTHLVTYHRYLRFLPTGEVLSLLANEDANPQHIIPLLKPELRMKGFMIGRWCLDGTTVYITELLDPGSQPAKYSFQMTLNLKSRPLGRWNKLDLAAYDSVDVATGEASAFTLKHERPYWFSKVRSYRW
ncbi:hypothetical protein SISNIDRAFT_453194 [Sistotremastrum niveocremeum HHB9708]|uniref:F-box protein Hrt3/FBXO9 C-terminal domain-containing protein n=1 Tax=Sistotremastrum niveocremeum HHB9708 TaxID=1314777 RepID=A0A164VNK0_9AGAM|nr:hypothetical protein SISNIDRAFT_453194 [Sistotremastrum niveocremeum HHB9708]